MFAEDQCLRQANGSTPASQVSYTDGLPEFTTLLIHRGQLLESSHHDLEAGQPIAASQGGFLPHVQCFSWQTNTGRGGGCLGEWLRSASTRLHQHNRMASQHTTISLLSPPPIHLTSTYPRRTNILITEPKELSGVRAMNSSTQIQIWKLCSPASLRSEFGSYSQGCSTQTTLLTREGCKVGHSHQAKPSQRLCSECQSRGLCTAVPSCT